MTQIDLIVKYAPVLYGTNAIIGMVNACIIAFSGLKIGVTGMATPMAGAIVLFGFNHKLHFIQHHIFSKAFISAIMVAN